MPTEVFEHVETSNPNLGKRNLGTFIDEGMEPNYVADVVILPAWAEALVTTGAWISDKAKLHSERRITVAICLPRLEFSALFVAMGILRWAISQTHELSQISRLRTFVGTWVSYRVENEAGVGKLIEAPETHKDLVRIHESEGIKSPDFDEMSLSERMAYRPSKKVAKSRLIHSDYWKYILPTGKEFNFEKGARADQVKKATLVQERILAADKLLGVSPDNDLILSRQIVAQIFGSKSRLLSELYESLYFAPNAEACLFADVLRPAEDPRFSSSAHIQLKSSFNPDFSNSPGIWVMEGGTTFDDNLGHSLEHNRVFLLGRNAPSYDENAAALMKAYIHRSEDLAFSLKFPAHIKAVAFLHK